MINLYSIITELQYQQFVLSVKLAVHYVLTIMQEKLYTQVISCWITYYQFTKPLTQNLKLCTNIRISY